MNDLPPIGKQAKAQAPRDRQHTPYGTDISKLWDGTAELGSAGTGQVTSTGGHVGAARVGGVEGRGVLLSDGWPAGCVAPTICLHHVSPARPKCWTLLSLLLLAQAPRLRSEPAAPAADAAPAAAAAAPGDAAPAGPAPAPCRPSEFTCHKSARCVPLNRFCDQRHDCQDSSDEPRGCTPCNRTYYGDLGRTYELELHRPREDRLPFVCRLTFTASGGDLGDLVQLTFESFTLGRFVSFTADGCPDGALHISESERPRGGGEWCGPSWGSAVYVSETRSVSLLLRVLRLARAGQGAAAAAAGHGFDFRLAYKTLPRAAAVVRYGPPHAPPPPPPPLLLPGPGRHNESEGGAGEPEAGFHLGELMAGTSCSRLFSECSRRPCRLQSPNWPGVYPRNATCYYAVRQHEAPPGQHALIAVRQPRGQLVAIRSSHLSGQPRIGDGSGVAAPPAAAAPGSGLASGAASDRSQHDRRLKVWSECDEVQDYVTVYDGYTTRDPVLLRFCGGGEPVPEAVSSGPELLVQFSTAPYGTFLQQPPPPLPLHGFQLDVQVRYVPQQSWTYVRNKRCEFSVEGPPWRGWLEAPRHSLPRGATCRYAVRAPPGRRVWLALLKFHAAGDPPQGCDAASLALFDGELPPAPHALCLAVDRQCEQDKKDKVRFPAGGGGAAPAANGNANGNGNGTLLARFCRDVSPRSCEHALLRANASRPCSPTESFLSAGPVLTLQMHVREATALRPVEFVAQYEFVDVREAGEPLAGPRRPCARQFSASPQDGLQELSTPPNVFLYGRGGAHNISCTYRLSAAAPVAAGERVQVNVWLLDVPWPDAPPLRRRLLCPAGAPFSFLSAAAAVELRFRVTAMNATEDFSHIGFHATWRAVAAEPCAENRRLSGPSGEIRLRSPEKEYCDGQPWLIEPGVGRYLYVKIRGIALNETDGEGGGSDGGLGGAAHEPLVVCPSPARHDRRHRLVELFSEGWLPHDAAATTRGVVVELRAVEPGAYSLTWLELARRRSVHPPENFVQDDCPHRCPELDACINASLWCDGVAHCPSGADERLSECWARLVPLPWAAAALAALSAGYVEVDRVTTV
ncbi:uncharacterized protein LOC126278200 [Schistocerca gregaria]|uniref:uncharacterized protein LOC126278200 n=1 Tax=Schistocerca gregaria TaxID=7010 RepID=UPI00211E7724|nr:uncharacterized protein LOC126278200 [Schistocerca gregaria]